MEAAFLHGFCLSFGLILPLGVQNLFIFQQGMAQRIFLHAVPAIVTAAVCDTVLIFTAVGGVSLLLLHFTILKSILIFAGVLFLSYLGVGVWKQGTVQYSGEPAKRLSPGRQVLIAASVSLLNPYAIVDAVGMIGSSSLEYKGAEKLAFAGACCLVSWIWFFLLAAAGRQLQRLPDLSGKMRLVNRCSACFIWLAAAYLLSKAIA